MASTPSLFQDIKPATPIEVFKLIGEFNEDQNPNKVNLSVGAYRTSEGKPWVLGVVRAAEAQMMTDQTLNHEYLPVAGLKSFREAAVKLLVGDDNVILTQNRAEGIQALGGTGALRLCAAFLKKHLDLDTAFVANPTWGNHNGIFRDAGFSNIKQYRYWNAATKGLDLDGMLEDLRSAPPKSVVILHAVAHNPTGVDPTEEQWAQIADVCQEKNIFVVMDNAYQGFISGDVDKDAWSTRFFIKRGFEFFVAQSFSKNFGLYNERVGNVTVICNDSDSKCRVISQMELIVRTMWSNPPSHGARVVATVLNNSSLKEEWKQNVKTMAERILQMRQSLFQKLKTIGCPGDWNHIIKQKGMFSYTGLNEQQCKILNQRHHIYIMKSGRINMCGLTPSNMDYVANCIKDVVVGASQDEGQSKM